MQQVTIYTDGAALPTNPGRGGAGVVYLTWKDGNRYTREAGYYLGENVTNNAAEIQAAIKALDGLTKPCNVDLYTDSQYVAYTMSKGWHRGKNQELWAELDRAASRHFVNWLWVKGHDGNPLNERAHWCAEEAAKTMEDVTDAA
jgi:ribonuclease HI